MSRGAGRCCGGALRVGSRGVLSVLPWQRINQQPEAATAPLPPLTPAAACAAPGKASERPERPLQGERLRRAVPELGLTDTGWAHPRSPANGPAQLPHRVHRAPLRRASPGLPAAAARPGACVFPDASRTPGRFRLPQAPARRTKAIPGAPGDKPTVPKMRSRVPLMSSTGAANICG